LPGVQLRGTTTVESGAVIGPDTTLLDTVVGAGASVVRTHAHGAEIHAGASVGPFSFLRPGAVVGETGKVGAFVEIKNSTLHRGAKVPHLSYIGDAEIGEGANIGAGAITANYDGVNKHRTVVGAQARTGSHTVFVAPVTVGDGAYSAAGAVIRRDVPPGALAMNVAPQRNLEGWVEANREGTPAATAAKAAQGGKKADKK
jgi:bifunctional UDP-N-acetylglucosamine pyrophosphorylase/glucosamine-1-phosphate N-acetyltransferase